MPYPVAAVRGRGILQSAAVWTPFNLSTLKLWADFSDITTLKQSDGGAAVGADGDVIGWVQDKSGQGNHLSQSTTANKPIYKENIKNGRSIARFSSSDLLLSPSLVPFASKRGIIAMALYPNISSGFGAMFSTYNTSQNFQANITVSGSPIYKFYDNAFYYASALDTGLAWSIQMFHRTANTTLKFYRSSISVTDTFTISDLQPSTRQLGIMGSPDGGGALIGDVGEVVMADDVSAADATSLMTYLARWT